MEWQAEKPALIVVAKSQPHGRLAYTGTASLSQASAIEVPLVFNRPDLESEIWSRLPQELVDAIIKATDDAETLECWHLATSHHLPLSRSVQRAQWRYLTVDELDLVPQSGADTERARYRRKSFRQTRRPQKEEGKLYGAFDLRTPRNTALACTEHLTLKLLFWYTRHQSFQACSNQEIYYVTGETLHHSMDALFTGNRRLQSVTVEGRVPDLVVRSIISMPGRERLRALNIRRCRVFGWFFYLRLTEKGPATELDLDLSGLWPAPQLHRLEITMLQETELRGLAKSLVQLRNLQALELVMAGRQSLCPLMELLSLATKAPKEEGGFGDPEQPVPPFPPTLKVLTLIDGWQQ